MVRLSKSIYLSNETRIVNSSQSLCSIAAAGANFLLAELKNVQRKKVHLMPPKAAKFFIFPTNSHPLMDTTLYTTFCALQRIFNIFAMY